MKIFHLSQNKIIKIKDFEKTSLVLQGTTTVALGNFNFFYGKNHKRVLKNIRKLKKLLHLERVPFVLPQQVHGKNIAVIKSAPTKNISYYKKTDALITNCSYVLLGILTADCVPMFILDKKNKVISLVHAGWRGIARKLPQLTIKRMIKEFNTKPQDLLIGFGPYIGKCCYKVDKKVLEQLGVKKKKKSFIDLGELIIRQLLSLKIKRKQIIKTNLCNYHNKDLFFSYRRQKENAVRMISYMMLKEH